MTSKFGSEPFMFNKDLGSPVKATDQHFTLSDADGSPVIPLTQEQKYIFDTKGWLLIPGVLSSDQLDSMQEFITQLHTSPESMPDYKRSPLGGSTQSLSDHPIALGFLNEFVYLPYTDGRGRPLANQDCYGYRLEMSAYRYRIKGQGSFGPHNGNGQMRFPGDHHRYHCLPGKANAGLVRAIWELMPVNEGDGGTIFISGSHKSAFTAPESAYDPNSLLWETYTCPAGSVLFFSEAVTHSAVTWNAAHPRIAVLNSYNSIGGRWHNWEPHPRLVAEMPPLRQTLFRSVHVSENLIG